ncbi:MAG: phytanoyl-CoA dioxygenase family protein [Candidatus Hydrogenedentes bacterium]|nr:phytanoyl-CoA dioxygenase family protein [Candidatus Hydrogenedentota bacterium]
MMLTDAQRKHYEEEGYVLINNVLSRDEIDRYKTRARELANGAIPPGAEKMLVRDVRVVKGEVHVDDPEKGIWKLMQPDWYDKTFEPYPATPAILDVVEGLIGPDIKAFLTMMIYKPPGVHADHPFHQDSFYFAFGPHDLILGSWIALDKTDIENGTLVVLPRSHRLDLIDHDTPRGDMVNFGVFGAHGYEGSQQGEVALNLEPGDGAFFHSRLLHRTGPNTSTRHRRVMTVHFASAKCKTDGGVLPQLKFRLVRGREYEGCI